MVNYCYLYGSVNRDMAKIVENIYNQGYDKYVFRLTSSGGDVGSSDWILYIMNQHKDKTTLIADSFIYSCAFDLFFRFKGHKKLVKGTIGMIHKRYIKTYIDSDSILDRLEELRVKELKRLNKKDVKLFNKLKFNEKQLKKYNKGRDVSFSYKKMKKLLDHDTNKD